MPWTAEVSLKIRLLDKKRGKFILGWLPKPKRAMRQAQYFTLPLPAKQLAPERD
jgi:hypothetical protein